MKAKQQHLCFLNKSNKPEQNVRIIVPKKTPKMDNYFKN